jgi:hypothetical protein
MMNPFRVGELMDNYIIVISKSDAILTILTTVALGIFVMWSANRQMPTPQPAAWKSNTTAWKEARHATGATGNRHRR